MTVVPTPLAGQMRELAEDRSLDPLVRSELLLRANEFDDAASAFYGGSAPNPKAFLGAWARARRLYSEVSGEPLL